MTREELDAKLAKTKAKETAQREHWARVKPKPKHTRNRAKNPAKKGDKRGIHPKYPLMRGLGWSAMDYLTDREIYMKRRASRYESYAEKEDHKAVVRKYNAIRVWITRNKHAIAGTTPQAQKDVAMEGIHRLQAARILWELVYVPKARLMAYQRDLEDDLRDKDSKPPAAKYTPNGVAHHLGVPPHLMYRFGKHMQTYLDSDPDNCYIIDEMAERFDNGEGYETLTSGLPPTVRDSQMLKNTRLRKGPHVPDSLYFDMSDEWIEKFCAYNTGLYGNDRPIPWPRLSLYDRPQKDLDLDARTQPKRNTDHSVTPEQRKAQEDESRRFWREEVPKRRAAKLEQMGYPPEETEA